MRVEAAQDKALVRPRLSRAQAERLRLLHGRQADQSRRDHRSRDIMRMAPGFAVSPVGDGRDLRRSRDARNASGGCVNYYVDGFAVARDDAGRHRQLRSPGRDWSRSRCITARRRRRSSQKPGQTSCAAIVVWTQGKVRHDARKEEAVIASRVDGVTRRAASSTSAEMATECDACGARFDLVAGGVCLRCRQALWRGICTDRGCGGCASTSAPSRCACACCSAG